MILGGRFRGALPKVEDTNTGLSLNERDCRTCLHKCQSARSFEEHSVLMGLIFCQFHLFLVYLFFFSFLSVNAYALMRLALFLFSLLLSETAVRLPRRRSRGRAETCLKESLAG